MKREIEFLISQYRREIDNLRYDLLHNKSHILNVQEQYTAIELMESFIVDLELLLNYC